MKSTSEGLSFVAYGLDWREGDNVVGIAEEFPSNRWVWESLASRGVEYRKISLMSARDPEGALLDLTDGRTRLLAVSSVQYASGIRLDLARLGEACRQRGILFCVDAIQSLGALRFDVQAIGADFVSADGHKWLLAPEGLGLFYCRADLRQQLVLHEVGWHGAEDLGNFDQQNWQPAASARRFECGSPNMLGIYGLDASLGVLLAEGLENVERQVLERVQHLMEEISRAPELELLTPRETARHGGIVTFKLKHGSAQQAHAELMRSGVICAPRGGGIRFAPHFYTPYSALDEALVRARHYASVT